MNKSQLVTIRPMREGDKAFIYSTWLRGVYYGETIFKEMEKDRFMKEYHTLIENIMSSSHTVINVACLREDEDVILGYSAGNANGQTVYFAYVKSAWRKIGLASMLVGTEIKFATTLTTLGLSIIRRKNIEFNPFTI